MTDQTRRKLLKTGAAATVIAATPRALAEQAVSGGAGPKFYEKGAVRIRYEEHGSGFPLLLIAGGGLNSTIAGADIPSTRSGNSRVSTGASRPICATPIRVSPPARSRSIARGMPTLTTTSV